MVVRTMMSEEERDEDVEEERVRMEPNMGQVARTTRP